MSFWKQQEVLTLTWENTLQSMQFQNDALSTVCNLQWFSLSTKKNNPQLFYILNYLIQCHFFKQLCQILLWSHSSFSSELFRELLVQYLCKCYRDSIASYVVAIQKISNSVSIVVWWSNFKQGYNWMYIYEQYIVNPPDRKQILWLLSYSLEGNRYTSIVYLYRQCHHCQWLQTRFEMEGLCQDYDIIIHSDGLWIHSLR